MTFDVKKAERLCIRKEFITDRETWATLMDACEHINKLEKVRSIAASLMSEDGATEALAHYNVLHALADALKECEEKT